MTPALASLLSCEILVVQYRRMNLNLISDPSLLVPGYSLNYISSSLAEMRSGAALFWFGIALEGEWQNNGRTQLSDWDNFASRGRL